MQGYCLLLNFYRVFNQRMRIVYPRAIQFLIVVQDELDSVKLVNAAKVGPESRRPVNVNSSCIPLTPITHHTLTYITSLVSNVKARHPTVN